MLHRSTTVVSRCSKYAATIDESELHQSPQRRNVIAHYMQILTFGARHCTLQLSCHKSQFAPSIPRRMLRAILESSRILCGVWSQFHIRRSKLDWTPRSKQSDGSGSDLPLPATLQTQRIRNSFLPPFRLPQQKSTAFPRSAIRRIGICPHRSMDCHELRDY
jgi:hypothetical protein